jgi:hypothetical protein
MNSPGTGTIPTFSGRPKLQRQLELIDYIYLENERDQRHFMGN